jgi:hypothetical protein
MNAIRKYFGLKSVALIIAIVALLFGGAGITAVTAQSALPGDALYPVKTTIEQTRLSLASDAGNRAQMKMEFAEQRLEEIAALIEEGRFQDVSEAVLAFEADINGAILELDTLARVDPARAAQIALEITRALTGYYKTLSALAISVPESVKPEVTRALNTAQIAGSLDLSSGEVELDSNENSNDQFEDNANGNANANDNAADDNANLNDNGDDDQNDNANGNTNDDSGNDNGDDNGGGSSNDNGDDDQNGNTNGNANDDSGNDNGDDSGGGNANDNTNDDSGNDNGDDSGGSNANDNANDNTNDDSGNDNGDDSGGGGANDNGNDNQDDNSNDNTNDDSGNDNGNDSGGGGGNDNGGD